MADSGESQPTLRSSWSLGLPVAAFLVLVAVVWRDPLLEHRNFAGRDLIPYNLPMEKVVHDAYARGHFPLWVDEVSGGRPVLPNPNAGALYPVRILLSPLPFPLAVKLFTVLHWALAAIGLLVLARALGISRSGAWMTAVTYVFSGVVVSELFFPHILPGMALLPWIAWALLRPGSFASKAIGLSLALALLALAADVFTFGMAVVCGAGWIAFAARAEERRRLALLLALAIGLAALAALPQIVATLAWVPETNRAVLGITWREALQFSVAPARLLELLIPYPFGAVWTDDHRLIWGLRVFWPKTMGLFLTLYAGALAPIACVVTARRRGSAAVRFGRFLVAAGVVLSVSWFLIPAAWREHAAPLALRNPEKFAVLLSFGLALVSGVALDELRARPRLPRAILATGAGLAILAVLAAVFPQAAGRVASGMGEDVSAVPIASQQLPWALSEAAFFWTASYVGLELVRGGGALGAAGLARLTGLAVLTLVPIAATRRIGWTFREEAVFAPPAIARYVRRVDPEGRYRTLGEMVYREPGALEAAEGGNDIASLEIVRRNFDSHASVLWGTGAVLNADFDNGDFSRVESVRKLSGTLGRFRDGGAVFLGSLSLRFGQRYRDQPPLPGFAAARVNGNDAWDQNPEALPDIRLVTGWKEEPDVLAALRDLSTLGNGEIVVESGRSTPRMGSSPGGEVRLLERTPERLLIETQAPSPGWLFVLRGFWRHRVVRVDGSPVEVVPAQLAFSAIPIPAGRHRVEWTESFPGWSVSRLGPPLFAASLGSLWILSRRRPPLAGAAARRFDR